MVDRQTRTLWENLTGEAVLGRLAEAGPSGSPCCRSWSPPGGSGGAAIPPPPCSPSTPRWRSGFGFRYQPGAAEQRRAGVAFPVWLRSGALDPRAEIYAVRLGERAKAYPVERALRERVINDRLGGEPLVLVADPDVGGGARLPPRRPRRSGPAPPPASWSTATAAAGPPARRRSAPAEPASRASAPLPRLPGHQSFWLGWYAFFPQAELYGGAPPVVP